MRGDGVVGERRAGLEGESWGCRGGEQVAELVAKGLEVLC